VLVVMIGGVTEDSSVSACAAGDVLQATVSIASKIKAENFIVIDCNNF